MPETEAPKAVEQQVPKELPKQPGMCLGDLGRGRPHLDRREVAAAADTETALLLLPLLVLPLLLLLLLLLLLPLLCWYCFMFGRSRLLTSQL